MPRPVLHLLVPTGVDDPARPSGGNVYDRHLRDGLAGHGWTVRQHEIAPGGDAAGATLAGLGDGALVLVDGLLTGTASAAFLGEAGRLQLVVLVHQPRGPGTGEAALLGRVAAVVTTSRWTRDWLRSTYGVAEGRVHVALPGVDPAPPTDPSPSGRWLLCVAALTPGKGQEVLLDALEPLGGLDWTCSFVGSPEVDPAYAAGVRRRTEDSARYCLTGPLTGVALASAYGGADLVVLPSYEETYGMVLAEALAHGVPVLATDVGGVREALGEVEGRLPGLLVPPGRPDLLGDALRAWLTDPALRDRLRRDAALRAPTLPTWDRTTAVVHRVLDQVLQNLHGKAGEPDRAPLRASG